MIVYPQSALWGFGQALASKLGVEVEFRVGQPCTNGKTIYLPEINGALDKFGFDALCGVACHEAAHVYFGSCAIHRAYGTTNLRAACMNAVLDVSDETRMENVIPHSKQLFLASNAKSKFKIIGDQKLRDGNADKVWQLLASGILMCRSFDRNLKNELRRARIWKEALGVYHILKQAKTRASSKVVSPKYAKRTGAQWAELQRIADELVAALQPYGEDKGKDPADTGFGPIGIDAEACSDGAAHGGVNAGNVDATVGDGAGNLAGEAPKDAEKAERVGGMISGSGGIGRGDARGQSGSAMEQSTYAEMRPAITGPIERMAVVDDADGGEDGYFSGPRLGGHIERAMIDGRCFARKHAEGEKLQVAISLDKSESMRNRMGECAAVAQSFADAMIPISESVALSSFDIAVNEVRNFRDVGPCTNGTYTGDAVRWATEKLAGLPGRRVMVIITDGRTAGWESCVEACQLATSKGIRIIGVAYNCPPEHIMLSMPGAHILGASSPLELGAKLTGIAAEIVSR